MTQGQRTEVKFKLFAVMFIVTFLLTCLGGCSHVTRVDPELAQEYKRLVQENRKIYDKLVDPFKMYISEDVFVDEITQADYALTIFVWKACIERNEQYVTTLRSLGLIK